MGLGRGGEQLNIFTTPPPMPQKPEIVTVVSLAEKYGIIGEGIKHITIKDGKGFYDNEPIEQWDATWKELDKKDDNSYMRGQY